MNDILTQSKIMNPKQFSHIIWDWNGTLLDDVHCCFECINRMLARRGLKTLENLEEYHGVFTFPVIGYYKKLGFDFEKEPFEELSVEYMDSYVHKAQAECGLHRNTEIVLARIAESGIRQVVLSASKSDILKEQTHRFPACSVFEEILGNDNIYANGKIEIALDYICRAKVQKALLVGDTLHDHEVARAIGADCVLIANGHHSRSVLRQCGAAVLDDIALLPDYIGI
ncbi:MAG: HAD hydrolase-like protein [Oscillospiraceae bacterium]|jgi:phosphoglycolate phosphatase|nr:HAD hydrolase-like protein [Oscillospiraceae bacterium]